MFSIDSFRAQFPILATTCDTHPLVYLDNGATTQKSLSVINASSQYYLNSNANVHRASHYLSAKATKAFEQVRVQVQNFINAKSEKEIIWTKGTTESINIIAQSYALPRLSNNDEIVISMAEHHANIVPWQHVAQVTGAKLIVLPLDTQGRICLKSAKELITSRCKLLSINHISNVIGKINPIKELIALVKQHRAITIIDGAQAIAHIDIDVQDIDCDFYVYSAHKMYGPNGIGVLYGKQEILECMRPYQFGGEMIKKVSFTETTYNELPFKFEAGTPNIVGVIGLGESTSLLTTYNKTGLVKYEHQINEYAYAKLSKFKNIDFLAEGCPDIPLFTITVNGYHHQDLAAFLDSKGIAVRSGHHCAMPLMEHFKVDGAVRISLAAYNTLAEIDYLIVQINAFMAENNPNTLLSNRIEEENKNKTIDHSTQQEVVIDSDNCSTRQPMFLTVEDIKAKFQSAKSWDLKHRQIMLLAKHLIRLDKMQRVDEYLISGCESKAWLKYTITPGSKQFAFTGDSDAKVIRGLMVIILSAYQGKTANEIVNFNIGEYFDVLGLMQHLSPSRGNGVNAIVERIKEIAQLSS